MYFKKLEDGSKEEVELWEKFKNLSLQEFDKVYDVLELNLILMLERASIMIKWMQL
jgi:arginyl-tRNA synthetase